MGVVGRGSGTQRGVASAVCLLPLVLRCKVTLVFSRGGSEKRLIIDSRLDGEKGWVQELKNGGWGSSWTSLEWSLTLCRNKSGTGAGRREVSQGPPSYLELTF